MSFVTFASIVLGSPEAAQAQMAGAPTAGYKREPGMAASAVPAPLREIGFDQNLDRLVPLDTTFRDEAGATVRLGDYFGTRPVVLVFAYYDCPMLCTMVINGLASALDVLSLEPGKDFEIVTVSFDPRDTPATAAAKRPIHRALQAAGRRSGWHFLTGDQASIDRLTKAAGFRYVWDKETRQFAHPTGVIVLTPDGRLARYLFGIEYGPRDLRYALVEAVGRHGRLARRCAALLYCYHYDPMTGRYGLVIMRAIRLAGAATVLALGAFIIVMVRREKRASTRPNPLTRGSDPRCGPGPRSSPNKPRPWPVAWTRCTFFLLAISVFFSLLIAGLIVFYAVKYRRRSPDASARTSRRPGARDHVDRHPVPDHDGDLRLGRERLLRDVQPARRNAQHLRRRQAVDVEVPAPRRPARNQRAARAGRAPVKLIMTSEDVIHDVFVPAFRVKADVLPGRYTSIWFQPTKPGRYHLFCAEYCGTRHSGMIGEVIVMEPTEYQAWLSGGTAEGSLASAGEKLFHDLACNTCHRPDAQGRGPVLEGLFGKTVTLQSGETMTVDEAYVRESILKPAAKITAGFQPIMPTFQGLVTEEQLLELIEYVKSLNALPQVQTR